MSGRVRVDETDFRILREIFHGDEESFRSDRIAIEAVARRLGLHRNTVSARVRRLTESRVLLPASLDVEPAQFGLVGAMAFVDAPRERRTDEMAREVFRVEGVRALFLLAEGYEVVAFAESDEALFATVERVRAITGATRARFDILSSRDYPPVEPVRLTPLDARLMVALLDDARASFDALAARLGVTATTAKRRYERLRREGVLYMHPSGGLPVEGVSLAYVVADVPDLALAPAAKRALLEVFPNHWMANTATRASFHAVLYGRSLDALERQAHEARRVPGVAGVDLRVMSGLVNNDGYTPWLARVIERRAEARAPPPAP